MELKIPNMIDQHRESKLRSGGVLVLSRKKSSMDDEVIGFTLGTGYGIKLALNESTDLGSLIGSSEWSGTDLIQGLSI